LGVELCGELLFILVCIAVKARVGRGLHLLAGI
jgi:hypothetical protein